MTSVRSLRLSIGTYLQPVWAEMQKGRRRTREKNLNLNHIMHQKKAIKIFSGVKDKGFILEQRDLFKAEGISQNIAPD